MAVFWRLAQYTSPKLFVPVGGGSAITHKEVLVPSNKQMVAVRFFKRALVFMIRRD
jgi:hypothetical protein